MRRLVAALVTATALAASAPPPISAARAQDDAVRRFLDRLETVIRQGDGAAYVSLLAGSADRGRAAAFAGLEMAPGMTRVVVQERDRQELPGTLPGDGYRLVVDAFEEYGDRARVSTWALDIKRAGEAGSAGEWAIADEGPISSVEDLYRLSLDATRRFAAHNLDFSDEDLDLTLPDGSAFVGDIDRGTTALVFIGRGTMRFHPAPPTEKSQVKIFSGADGIETPFDAVYLRINPDDFERLVSSDQLTEAPVDQAEFRRADRIFHDDSPKSFTVDLGDLSRDVWAVLPSPRDFVAEIHTRRFDTLTYSRASASPEDISLFDRAHRKTIALYASRLNAGRRGAGDIEAAPFGVRRYDIDVSLAPDRRWIEGRARLAVQVGANPVSSLTLRLADSLVVQSVVSDVYGRLFSLRVKDQGSLLVSLPAAVPRGGEFALTITYAGRLDPQTLDAESMNLSQRGGPPQEEIPIFEPEPSFVYSNQNDWYPRPASNLFATATIRVTVPANMSCVATGEPDKKSPVAIPAKDSWPARRLYTFNATRPVRYLAFAVGHFAAAQQTLVTFSPEAAARGARVDDGPHTVNVAVQANRANIGRGRELRDRAVDIVRFYESLLGDAPYESLTVALTEDRRPGGHSPAYFAVLNEPPPAFAFEPRNDPASFDRYPDFFLAHELAHQWWGQAVGWRTYHEQWLSESFAQYFAALYAQHVNLDAYHSMMRQMRRWAADETDAGPISLGYRLGHIQGDSRIYRALVYDKGALVLHMLRELVGDEAFFKGLRRFYRDSRFRSSGTDDFKAAMEAEAGRPLTRFFDRWIYASALPRVAFSYRIDGPAVILHVEQLGDVFDLPLAITLQYADRTSADVIVPVTERIVDWRVPLAGTLRSADISRDDAPLADIGRN